MVRVKVSELSGVALDWAVAKCEGMELKKYDSHGPWYVGREIVGFSITPSTNWSQGGPIIERGLIMISPDASHNWRAQSYMDAIQFYGDKPLVAAMRCYVASALGDEVNIPEELLK